MKWQTHTQGFIARVEKPAMIPNQSTLERCRQGLTRQMKKAKTHQEAERLKMIRDEIDFLIDAL
jgi:predicted transcriptional regulator